MLEMFFPDQIHHSVALFGDAALRVVERAAKVAVTDRRPVSDLCVESIFSGDCLSRMHGHSRSSQDESGKPSSVPNFSA
jgi:hypothetical protein